MTGEKSGEFRGKTVEAAISAGLATLRLTREEVEVEVIKSGSRGVLGIGAEEALVRLTQGRPGQPEPKATARPDVAPVVKAQAEPTPSSGPKPAVEPGVKSEPPRSSRPAATAAPGSADDKAFGIAEQAREFLAGLLERMGLRASVEITAQSDAEADEDGSKVPVLNIVGNDLEVLIGRQNETVSALEFITRLMVNQQSHTRSSFVVDVNGYRSRRAESLRKLAFRTAEQVAQTNRTMALEPMPPAERRVIHLALREHPQVYTQSVGEGDRRKVTVIPKKD